MNKYRINFPDGSRKHVKSAERDALLLSGLIAAATEPFQFNYVGQTKTYHSFSTWGSEHLAKVTKEPEPTGFLNMNVVFEHAGKRQRQPEARPGEMICSLKLQGAIA